MSAIWYALHSKPRKEAALERQARAEGFEIYLPLLRVKPVNPRSRIWVPYFPGYLFLHVDLVAVGASRFNWMPYAQGLVSFGGEPASVPEALVRAVRVRVEKLVRERISASVGLRPGDRVSICEGPMAGYEAVFQTHLSGAERVRVLLRVLGGDVKLELPVAQIAALRNRPVHLSF
jgi:transcriptional antiterminator RfaH